LLFVIYFSNFHAAVKLIDDPLIPILRLIDLRWPNRVERWT
jgi:hypothetical protein